MGELKVDGAVRTHRRAARRERRQASARSTTQLARGGIDEVDARPMDFTYPPEAEAFRDGVPGLARRQPPRRAPRATGSAARSRSTRERARRRCARGTARSPTPATRRSRGPRSGAAAAPGVMEQVVFAEEMHRAQRAGHAQPARPLEHRARDHRARHRRAEAHAPPPHAPRRRHLVPGLLRAERGLRPRVAAHVGGARRRLLDRQRAEDLEHARPHRELVRAARAHRSRRAEAQGHHVPARRHDAAGRRGAAARHDHRREGVQRDLLHRRARARRLHARPGQRGLAGRDDDARVRARHRRQAAPRHARQDRAPASTRRARRRSATAAWRPTTRCCARSSRASTSKASCSSSSPTARSRPSCTAGRWARRQHRQAACGARPSSTSPRSRATCSAPTRCAGPWGRDRVYSRALTIAGGTTQVNKNILAQRMLGPAPPLSDERYAAGTWPLRVGSVSPGASGKWHATNWPGRDLADLRLLGGAQVLRLRAAGAEPAAARRRDRRRDLAGERRALARASTFGSGTGIAASSAGGVRVRGLRVEHVGRADLADLAEVHHDDAVAHVLHDREVVGDEDQREPVALLHVLEQVQDLRLHRHVERRDRLVADDQLRLGDDGAGDRDALALAAGELVRAPAALQRRVEADARASPRRPSAAAPRRCRSSRCAGPRRRCPRPCGAGSATRSGPGRSSACAGASRAARRPSSCVRSVPSNRTVPDVGRGQLHDRLAGRRLAAARLADEPERLARLHVEADVR